MLLNYWKRELAEYVRSKRKDTKQSNFGPKSTISRLETETANPTLGTIIKLIDAVGGDVSEAFKSRVPRGFQREHQIHHDRLQKILDGTNENRKLAVAAVLEQFARDPDSPE